MRFLIDECCDAAMIRALRLLGHDVVAMTEIAPRAPDTDVATRALLEGRILITEDKDFGQLVYASGQTTRGVILIRFPSPMRAVMLRTTLHVISEKSDLLDGAFVIIKPGLLRIRRA